MNLAALALVPTLFIQFTHPVTGELVFADGDTDKPVGVNVFGPGSKEYRAAQSAITNESIAAKRKKVTAELIERNAVELIARTTSEFVNFDYEGKGASLETNRAFYKDERFVHLRDQVQEKLGDYGNFLGDGSTS